jgi:hypothetical protein
MSKAAEASCAIDRVASFAYDREQTREGRLLSVPAASDVDTRPTLANHVYAFLPSSENLPSLGAPTETTSPSPTS